MFRAESLMEKLVDELGKLPGVGQKSAQRFAFYLLNLPEAEGKKLGDVIIEAKKKIIHCSICNNFTVQDPCQLCRGSKRDRSTICVVEQPSDVAFIEKTGQYHGLYYVLLGAISPLDGIGPKELKLNKLFKRVREEKTSEIIIATNPDTEGETTSLYITRQLRQINVRVTRLACGIPVGCPLESVSSPTLSRAIKGRINIRAD